MADLSGIEARVRELLGRPGRLAQLTDEGVTRTIVRDYFHSLPPIGQRRHLIDVGAAGGGIAEVFLRDGWTADLFEPDPAWQASLQQLAHAYAGRCRVHAMAVCDRDTAVSFTKNAVPGLSGLAASPFGVSLGVINVPGVRLDTFLKQARRPRVDFLKIDTEGGDFDVLRTLDDATHQPELIFVEYSYFFSGQTFQVVRAGIERMNARGYAALIFDYDDDGNFRRGNWKHRLVYLHATGSVPERANSFGNVLFYRHGDQHLLRTLGNTIDAYS